MILEGGPGENDSPALPPNLPPCPLKSGRGRRAHGPDFHGQINKP